MPGRERLRDELRLPKPRNAAGRNLPVAVAVGVALGALVIVAILGGPTLWYPLLSVATLLATWEVTTRLRQSDWHVPRTVLLIGGQAIVWSTLPWATRGMLVALILTVMCAVVQRLFFNGIDRPPRNWLRDSSAAVFVTLWIPVCMGFGAMLSTLEPVNDIDHRWFIFSFMIGVVASDVGGYVLGVFFGKHPMAKAISPKKSWEGFAGSMLFGIVVSLFTATVLLHQAWWFGIALGVGLVVSATLGDLVESQFKRDLGIKDMSKLIPGHGGLMDRLDGMLPAAAITWCLLSSVS
ncbi:phosphatidate cytidylyltransferase [Corynebacterium sp. TAE3-ERU12]|uniref:phosphatidate cytidylyltransferase n=1 Tax=Corynebacterium sp. TAE3-ERU12 TaxID=2849491 RepID=UPI001C471937|nr:phosphatidate cytidylyltransferase [Corynebacterium sp. TAE3-ERU12]MBV7295229.1 phosphatidate cytidylyltransferase [Corynebacterium sp. TAE3-ERU12]